MRDETTLQKARLAPPTNQHNAPGKQCAALGRAGDAANEGRRKGGKLNFTGISICGSVSSSGGGGSSQRKALIFSLEF